MTKNYSEKTIEDILTGSMLLNNRKGTIGKTFHFIVSQIGEEYLKKYYYHEDVLFVVVKSIDPEPEGMLVVRKNKRDLSIILYTIDYRGARGSIVAYGLEYGAEGIPRHFVSAVYRTLPEFLSDCVFYFPSLKEPVEFFAKIGSE